MTRDAGLRDTGQTPTVSRLAVSCLAVSRPAVSCLAVSRPAVSRLASEI